MKHGDSCLSQSLLAQAIGILFDYDEWWFEFFYSHKGGGLRLAPEKLIAESQSFSGDEQLMIKVALDLRSDGNQVSLSKIAHKLEWETLTRVLLAVMKIRDVSTEDLIEIGSRYES